MSEQDPSINDSSIQDAIQQIFSGQGSEWAPAGVVRRALEEAGVEDASTVIDELVAEGRLIQAGRGFRHSARAGTVQGRMDVLPDGNAYLRLKTGGGQHAEDIRIPRANLPKFVIHGDLVEAELIEQEGNAQPAVKVHRVVERDPIEFEGEIVAKGKHTFVEPDDPLAKRRVWVNPDYVEAAREGDRVRARLLPLKPDDPRPEAAVIAVLDTESVLETVMRGIVEERKISTEFPPEVLQEAEALPEASAEEDAETGMTDLRQLPMVTIDGITAKDFDDAVCVERTKDGYRVTVAVADVSRYVREGSALDREAYDRATSVYFPGVVYPMLPERLSNDLCSLVPGRDRPVVGVQLEFDADGIRTGAELFRGWIHSKARLTYGQVNEYLDDGNVENLEGVSKRIRTMLEDLSTLTRLRIQRRHERGALDFDLPEPEFVLGMHGEVSEILHFERRIAHRAVEEMMIAANEAATEILSEAGLPVLYRCHADPPPDKYEVFRKFAHHLGIQTPPTPTPEGFQKVALAVQGTPFEKSVHVLLLRTMSQAEYRPDNLGHFGLVLDHYSHFTSPIRRYPDLINHRWAVHYLERGGVSSKRFDEVQQQSARVAAHVTERERGAEKAERGYVKVLKARFMESKVGEQFEGVISGVAPFGVFVELSEYLLEGLVSFRDLGSDFFIYEEERLEVRGKRTKTRYRLGDLVEVELVKVNVEKGHIDFRMLAHHPLSYGRALEQIRARG